MIALSGVIASSLEIRAPILALLKGVLKLSHLGDRGILAITQGFRGIYRLKLYQYKG